MARYIHVPMILAALIMSSMYAYSGNDGPIAQQKKLISGNPLGGAFYENRGQIADTDGNATPDIKYYAFYNGARVYFTPKGWHTVYTVVDPNDEGVSEATGLSAQSPHIGIPEYMRQPERGVRLYRMDMSLVGCNDDVEIVANDRLPQYLNYYLPQCPDGLTNVPGFAGLRYRNIYNNIDLVLHASREGLKYEFEVRPGGKIEDIRLRHEGSTGRALMPDGSLHLFWPMGHTREGKPFSFQEIDNALMEIRTSYRVDDNDIQFDVHDYDAAQTLVIDPWSTYYGGSGSEEIQAIACDTVNAVLAAGNSGSQDFPLLHAWQSVLYSPDATVIKFDSVGVVCWATFFGGNGSERAFGLGVSADGSTVIAGQTTSYNLPHFRAFQPLYHGELDGFIAKFDSSGSRIWATYVGGSQGETLWGVATDSVGSVYAAGVTQSNSFPVLNPFQGQKAVGGRSGYDACFLKLSSDGIPIFSSFMGGNGDDVAYGIAVEAGGRFYVCGETASTNFPIQNAWQDSLVGSTDAFITAFDSSGMPLWSTYHGGSKRDAAHGVITDHTGNVLIAGYTESTDFPISYGWQSMISGQGDAYASKFTAQGNMIWSTYLGGADSDAFGDVVCDSINNVYLSGTSRSINFPTLNAAYPFQPDTVSFGQYPQDGVVVKFDSAGGLVWSTYLGGDHHEKVNSCAMDSRGNLYVAGGTRSSNFPVYNAVQPSIAGTKSNGNWYEMDGFITRITPDGRIPVTLSRLSAQRVSSGVELTWRSESEVNAYGFIIERRYEQAADVANSGWTDIGFVPSAAQGNEGRDYTYLDLDPGTTEIRIFYRLRMVDLDGSFEHSPVVEVAPESGALAVSFETAYPSPARDWLTLNFTLPIESGVSLSVHDVTGREITRLYDNQSIPSGAHSVLLPVGEWRSGLYLCTLTVNGQRLVRRAMVVR
jgi:hypothetical protein